MSEKKYEVYDSNGFSCKYVTNDGYLYRWGPKENSKDRIIGNFMMSTYENYPDVNLIQKPCLFVFVSFQRATFYGRKYNADNTLNLYRFKMEDLEDLNNVKLHIDKCDDGELYITWNNYSNLSSVVMNGHTMYKVLDINRAKIMEVT